MLPTSPLVCASRACRHWLHTGNRLRGIPRVHYWNSVIPKERYWCKKWVFGVKSRNIGAKGRILVYKAGIGMNLDINLEAKVTGIYYNTVVPYYLQLIRMTVFK